jgi:DNA mismatch repair ATPase MutS
VLTEAEEAAHDLALLSGVLQRLEAERFRCAHLTALRSELDTEGWPPSRRLARLGRLMDLADSRHHEFVRVAGMLLLWDLHLAYALENWRRASGRAMRRWLRAVGEMEALSSLAGHSYEHPADVFPEFVENEGALLEAEAIAHPLLPEDRAVANDLRIAGEPRVLVVSGSNMSGKSTLLRTLGINTVLAQAGGTVRARKLRLSPLAVGASIRIQDSLRAGESRFYAEITRLRRIVDAAEGSPPVLFLIDEFLHGTNSHDRRIGAEAIVRGLVDRGAIGLITTHDLALAHIADALGPAGANVHFEDHLENGRMLFDYRMRPGIVRKSNAIELMRSVGLKV